MTRRMEWIGTRFSGEVGDLMFRHTLASVGDQDEVVDFIHRLGVLPLLRWL